MRINPPKFSSLALGDIRIRPCREGDGKIVYTSALESRASLRHWEPWCYKRYTAESGKPWEREVLGSWENGIEYEFLIMQASTAKHLGNCTLCTNYTGGPANLSYWVHASHHNQGVASRAATLAAIFGFYEVNFRDLELVVAPENSASLLVAEKIGARFKGIRERGVRLSTGMSDGAKLFAIDSPEQLALLKQTG